MLEDSLVRPLLTFLLRLCYRIEVKGLEHYYASGNRVVIIANHQSFLDPLILGVFIPEKPAFAMNVFQAEKWYFRWVKKVFKIYTLDPTKPLSMKKLIVDLRKDAKVVIFPEGRITVSGGIMKIYDGTRLLIEKTGANVLPVHITGAEYSKFSKVGKKLRTRWFPKITVSFMPHKTFAEAPGKYAIYDIMTESAFLASNYRRPFLEALIDAYEWHGGSHVVATDISRVEMNYRQLFTRAFILSEKLELEEKNIAVLLPNALGAAVTLVALQILAKVPCMLNFSAGEANILHACKIAFVKTVLTSRAFIEKGKLESLIEALQNNHRIIYLEDVKPTVSFFDKLSGLMKALQPRAELAKITSQIKSDEPAVILYTSGSEGAPKGVALSHSNILANLYQCTSRLDLLPTDQLFNAMPVFHSFGLTVGLLMPLVTGIKTFLYPSPLHYRVIPELFYDSNSTIMLGTDTFFNGYARYANGYDFWNCRLAVAGAEKLRESTRKLWVDNFRVPIMQGYGVTEASPVVSFNTPLDHKPGTIGRVFPCIEWRIEAISGIEKGGKLLLKGPNIMLGYLKNDMPGVVQPQEEWYDTGDIVDVDADGFITILGRAKRFAKIGGEMVSLQAVEELALTIMPEHAHAAIAIPDPRKGEQIILYSESPELLREHIISHAKQKGVADIGLPKQVIFMQVIPRLGSGKIDYLALGKQVISID